MVTVLERLLDGIDQSAVPIRRLLLDRGFFRNNVLAYLRGRNVPFLMPVMFRGRKPANGKAATGWQTAGFRSPQPHTIDTGTLN